MSSIAMWTAIIELALRTRTRPGTRILISLAAGFAGIALLVIKPEVLAGSRVGSTGAMIVLAGASPGRSARCCRDAYRCRIPPFSAPACR
jgi:hypothetical protein